MFFLHNIYDDCTRSIIIKYNSVGHVDELKIQKCIVIKSTYLIKHNKLTEQYSFYYYHYNTHIISTVLWIIPQNLL